MLRFASQLPASQLPASLAKIVLVVLAALLFACGDDAKTTASGSASADAGAGSDSSALPDSGEAADAAPAPSYACPAADELLCDDRCVAASYSMDHCGACFNACVRGEMSCDEGACACLGGRTMCGEGCFDTRHARDHCGGCDQRCADSEACVDGGCAEISTRAEVVGVVAATNLARSTPTDCDTRGAFPAAAPVQLEARLNAAAQGHAEDMAAGEFLSHTGSDASTPGQRATSAGYTGRPIGENIARGYDTAVSVVDAWVGSDGHCANLMDADYDEMGVGHAVSTTTGEAFWVQLFGAR